MKFLDQAAKCTSLVLAIAAGSVIAVIMVMTTADVIKRFFTGSSIPGTAEFSEVFLVAAVYFGLAYAMRVGAHVGVDLVIMKMRGVPAKAAQIVGFVVSVSVLLWMLVETTGTAMHSIAVNEYRYGLIRVPVWPAKIAIPIGLLALILECIVAMLSIARGGPSASGESPVDDEQGAQTVRGV